MQPLDDGQYTFLYKLDEDGYDESYLAEDTLSGELVTVKVPRVLELEDALKNEINILKELSPPARPHPHIVQPRGVKRFRSAEGDERLCIIIEFVPGKQNETDGQRMQCNLEEYLTGRDRSLPIDPLLLVEVITQVCSALTYAHQKNICHRDIKPRNLLVRLPEGIVKVARWVAAKDIARDGIWNNSFVGTPPYMAPEVLRLNALSTLNTEQKPRPSESDFRADIFALGVTVFKIAVKTLPFRKGSDISDPAHRLRQQEALASIVGEPLAAVIMRAMAFEADERWSSAEAFAEALRGALQAVPAVPSLEKRLQEVIPLLQETHLLLMQEPRCPSLLLEQRLEQAIQHLKEDMQMIQDGILA